jgi:hypothetical protein
VPALFVPREVGLTQSQASQRQDQIYLPIVDRAKLPDWPMAGANPQRTSYSREEVPGRLKPVWYRQIEPFILDRVQIVAALGNLYISTARGLYVLDAATGGEKWVFPTEMPLGHSPTVHQQVVYVGGFDHKIYAIHALTGKLLWTFEAGAGFDTNPLVVQGMVFAGNRDGYFYAIRADGINSGQLAWKYKTGGPIHFSAAYKDGVVYFAADDSRAYALNATTGQLVWRSEVLPGSGFHSWWPVIYRDWVILAGSNNYRAGIDPGEPVTYHTRELSDVYPHYKDDPRGTFVGPIGNEPGDWVPGTPTINTSKPTVTNNGSTTPITEYFEDDGHIDFSRHDHKPWRRTYFVLNRANGKELTFDSDRDGNPEYAPILWFGTQGSGNRYPPVVGFDGVLYQPSNFMSDSSIAGGNIVGWKIGTPYVGLLGIGWNAVDEPLAISAGGTLIYIKRICDRIAGSVNYSIPATNLVRGSGKRAQGNQVRTYSYYEYNLPKLVPGYNTLFYPEDPYNLQRMPAYGDRNGSYACHGDENPPIPYQGKVFVQTSNAIIAFAANGGSPVKLPLLKTVTSQNAAISVSDEQLKSRLTSEVEKILAAGHLRPGYYSSGLIDINFNQRCGANLVDYFSDPADTIITLLRALPYLSPELQSRTRDYIKSEFSKYPPYKYTHIGWKEGAPREAFSLPPDIETERLKFGPQSQLYNFQGWKYSPMSFYAMWKYAQVFGNAKGLFDAGKARLEAPPSDSYLLEMPHVHNAYIDGYWGYLELQKMAGYPESAGVRSELNRLLQLRKNNFTEELPESYFQERNRFYCRALSGSRNFMYLVPELAGYLRQNASSKVQIAVNEYERDLPYWFVSKVEAVYGEAAVNHLYDTFAIFQAKAMILQQPRSKLVKYLDVPAFQVGDLFYIQKLISTIEAGN